MDDNDILLQEDGAKEFIEQQTETGKLSRITVAAAAVLFAFALHSLYSICYYMTDKSIASTICPRQFEADAPVLMKPLRDGTPENKDRWMRGFIRRFVTSQFPRSGKDVLPFFSYAANHSKGVVSRKFQALVKDHADIATLVDANQNYSFYPKFGFEDKNQALRIRETDKPGRWIVEFDGFLLKNIGRRTERYIPTLRYVVEVGPATKDNVEGLYVTEANIEQMIDYVSGTKENL